LTPCIIGDHYKRYGGTYEGGIKLLRNVGNDVKIKTASSFETSATICNTTRRQNLRTQKITT